MGCCAVLEYVTASWPKSIDPVVSLENVRLATVVHVRSTLPCGRSDRVKLPNRRNRIGLWRAPSRVMRLKAGPSLTPYELACALIEAVSSKLGLARNFRPFLDTGEHSCGDQYATPIHRAKGRDQHDRAIL
jgi:hypothetical protein